mgnify:CR=1 FL=1
MINEEKYCGEERRSCEFPSLRELWKQNFLDMKKFQDDIKAEFISFKAEQNKRLDDITKKFQDEQVEKAKNSWVVHLIRYIMVALGGAFAVKLISAWVESWGKK